MKQSLILPVLTLAASAALAGTPVPDKNAKAVIPPQPEKKVVTFDFQERLRFEFRENNFDFNDGIDSVTDDSWLLQRARVGVKVQPTDFLTFYVQGQSSLELDSDRPNVPGALGAEGDDAIDLRQAYIAIGPKEFNVTIGRQILSYGDERLIGGFDWNNFGRTFDAVKVHYAPTKDWFLDVFASSVVVVDKDEFNQSDLFDGNDTGRNQVFYGAYFSTAALCPLGSTTDFYALGLHEEYTVGDTDFATLGTRVKADITKTGGWDYETEMAVQFGDVKSKDLTAFAGHWGAGYVWTKAAWKPRLFVEYNFATGDSNAADGDVETFQNLFPTNHKFYGYMDAFSWQNIHNPAISFSVNPIKTVKLQLDYHAFWLADTADAWYRANGVTAVRPINKAADNFVGTELDFTATWKATKQLSFLVGYSHFFAGDYLKQTGSKASDDADFAYVQATFDF
ncbi:alginate export protein [Roseimicrobium gellanilyticum]|uniref:Alginate export protein n=1 Tax=Roseimicrobium gellanilyticum TaxID=748857 RepID=A0A366HTM8_9BACT|nr:alginate export family protein [Roseimicrobium gellanilyticum]RBP47641.1 alginate export protein [Roseimicrobium gellanilyticum]